MNEKQKRVVLITGATDGLGKGIAIELASKEEGRWKILVHGRHPERIEATVNELRSLGAEASPYRADLASLAETKAFAEFVLSQEPHLDVLVNNAGIGTTVPGGPSRQTSKDDLELRFAVNYHSHYVLTKLLLPLLEKSAPARIVNVSSAGQAAIDFSDPMLQKNYDGVRAYCQSKLAQILFTIDLAKELREKKITVNALHPATYMATKIVPSPISGIEEGVRATVRLIESDDVKDVTGKYFDGTRETRANAQAYDEGARAKLRKLSDEIIANAKTLKNRG